VKNNKYYSFCWLLVLLLIFNSQAKDKPLKIFILAGQSNMQGTGQRILNLLSYLLVF
jgi:hypothetical protein